MSPENNRRSFLRGSVALCVTGLVVSFQSSWVLAQRAVKTLGRITSQVIRRSDADYENWRSAMTWYLRKPARYPDAIVLVESLEDIIEAVNYARDHGLKLVTRGSGHASNQTCLRDGGLLLDLSKMRKVQIDENSQTADLEPGARAMDLMAAAEKYNLSFPAVHAGVVGMGGFLLGGGMGWNVPKWGIACRSVIEADIVMADGSLVTANEDTNPDLLWALRGAGPGFFGVVVRFRVKLFPLPKAITTSNYIFSEEQIPALAETLERLMPDKDARIEAVVTLKKNEKLSPLPSSLAADGIHCSVGFLVFSDSLQESRRVLAPFASDPLFKKAAYTVEDQELTYQYLYTPRDGVSNRRTNVDNMWTDSPKQTLLAYVDLIKQVASPYSRVRIDWGLNVMGSEVNSSIPNFADHYVILTLIADEDSHLSANNVWMDKSDRIVRKYAKGHYINEAEYQRFPDRIPGCFSESGWRRLHELRSQYDPQGVFHNFLGY